jgi:hypothetical protein
MDICNCLVSFLFSLMKKGNEKNQENLTLYSFSLDSLHFIGTQNFRALMKASLGSSFELTAAKQTKRKIPYLAVNCLREGDRRSEFSQPVFFGFFF